MFEPRRILVPTDFSACAAAALDCAVGIASRFGAEIVLVHVVPTIAPYLAFPSMALLPAEWLESTRMQAQAALAKEAERARQVKVTTELRDGAIDDAVIATAAARDADLIVIGTHGRRGIPHVFLGSVAERVVRRAPMPVLTVRGPVISAP